MSKSYNYDGAVPHQVAFSDGTPCWRRNWLPIFVAVVVVVVVIVVVVVVDGGDAVYTRMYISLALTIMIIK